MTESEAKNLPDLTPVTKVEFEMYELHAFYGDDWILQDTVDTLKTARRHVRNWREEDRESPEHGPSEYCIVKVTTTETREVVDA